MKLIQPYDARVTGIRFPCVFSRRHHSSHYQEFFKVLIKTYGHFLISFLNSAFLNYCHSGSFVILAQWIFTYILSSCIFSPTLPVHPNLFFCLLNFGEKIHDFFSHPNISNLVGFQQQNSSSKSLIGGVKSCSVEMRRP